MPAGRPVTFTLNQNFRQSLHARRYAKYRGRSDMQPDLSAPEPVDSCTDQELGKTEMPELKEVQTNHQIDPGQAGACQTGAC